MMSISKRHRENREAVDSEARYELSEAISILQDSKKTKFEESIDVAINLGIDPKQSDQNIRGSAALPNGTGKPSGLQFSQRPMRQQMLKKQALIKSEWMIWLKK